MKNDKDKKIVILDIDGGGVHGIIIVHLLKELEKLAGKDISFVFNAYSGVSAGALIVAALNIPSETGDGVKYNADQLTKIFPSFVSKVFRRPFWYKICSLWGLIGPIYHGKSKSKAIEEFFGHVKMSEIKHHISIMSANVNHPGEVRFGINRYFFRGVVHENHDFYLKDTLDASSAAPIFFPTTIVKSTNTKIWFNLMDGGIITNTPALVDLVSYEKFMPETSIYMLSIGMQSFLNTNHSKALSWGILRWGSKLINIGFSGRSYLTVGNVAMAQQDFPNFKVFQRMIPDVPSYLQSSFDSSPQYIAKMEAFAQQYAQKAIPELKQFLDSIQKADG